jgi:hypothetical protein
MPPISPKSQPSVDYEAACDAPLLPSRGRAQLSLTPFGPRVARIRHLPSPKHLHRARRISAPTAP